MRLLAIDYGVKRTGIAATDPLQLTAQPLLTIETEECISWLKDYVKKEEVEKIIVGMPRQTNGEPSASAQYIKPFVEQLQTEISEIPICYFDERFTSVLAHRAMIDSGIKKKSRQDKALVDKIAACIILEDYMNSVRK